MNTQKKFSVRQNSIVFMTGNNLMLSDDLAGRCLLVDLEVREADPQARKIERVIDELYLAKPAVRRDCLSALWALVRAWDKAGRPKPSSVFRGFEAYSDIFGGIVQHTGYGNPLESAIVDISDTYSDMLALVEKLAENLHDEPIEFEFSQLVEVCRTLNLFEWHLEGKTIKGNAKDYERFELSTANKSWFGKLFSQRYGGTEFVLSDRRRIRFGKRGRNRHRRYILALVQGENQSRS